MIPDEQRKKVIQLYLEGDKVISDILQLTGIRSEQTLYRILRENNIAIRFKRCPIIKSISFESDIFELIKLEAPRNLSAWVCERIRKSYK